MRKNSYIFTAILAIVVSTGAWADAPDSVPDGVVTDPTTGAHNVYRPENLADSGIAGVTYVNRVGEMAGAAAQAAEAHAAHASKSASAAQSSADSADAKAADAAAAAAAAQASADDAADAANSITNGDGITIVSADKQKKITVNPKTDAGIVVDKDGVAVKAGLGIDLNDGNVNVTPGAGIKIHEDTVAVNMGAGLKTANDGAVTINEGVGLKLEGNVLVPNLTAGDSVTITQGTDENADKLVISVQPSDTLLDAATNQVLGNVNAGTAITVTPTIVGGEVTDIEISANAPTATTPGVVYVPSWQDIQNGKLPNGVTDYSIAMGLQTYMDALTELVPSGAMSGSYQNYTQAATDGNATLQGDSEAEARWRSKPLSAGASYDLALLYRDETVSLEKDTNGNTIYNVGNDARPVYVVGGAAAAVKSVAIPVDADNFENATTTAKIWIQ